MTKAQNSIQAARAVAAMAVTLGHLCAVVALSRYFNISWIGIPFSFGHSGVEFFFVLSGYIIYSAHQNSLGRVSDLPKYVIRRLTRVYPTYWVVFLIVYTTALAVPSLRATVPLDVYQVVHALLLLPQSDLGHEGTGAPVLVVAWTLQYEILFYTVFGCFIVSRAFGFFVLALFCLSGVLLPSAFGEYQFFFTRAVLLLFPLGILVALLVERGVKLFAPRKAFFVGCSGFIFVAAIEIYRFRGSQPEESHLAYGLFSAIIIYSIVRLERECGWFKDMNFWKLLGDSSYSLYLIHFPIISACVKIGATVFPHTVFWAVSVIIFTATLCLVSSVYFHKLVESPISKILSTWIQTKAGVK